MKPPEPLEEERHKLAILIEGMFRYNPHWSPGNIDYWQRLHDLLG